MKDKIQKNYTLEYSTCAVIIIMLMIYTSNIISNKVAGLISIGGLVIIWFFIGTFIIVRYLKKDSK